MIDPKVDCGIAALAPSRISAVIAAKKRSPESLNPLSKNRRLVICMSLLLDYWIENPGISVLVRERRNKHHYGLGTWEKERHSERNRI